MNKSKLIPWITTLAGHSLTWWPLLAFIAAGLLMFIGVKRIPEHYRAQGRAQCAAATTATAASAVVAQAASVAGKATSDIARADKAGAMHERKRTRIDAHFQRLAEEARHDPSDPVDACVLPAARLVRWQSANAGSSATDPADPGAAASQPDHGASAPTQGGFWAHVRLGDQPPRRGEGLPPAGQQVLQPPFVPGDITR